MYEESGKLPSYKELVSRFGVAVNTIQNAMAILRKEGLTESVHGRGVFVCADRPDEQAPEDRDPLVEIDAIRDEMAVLSRRLDDLVARIHMDGA